MERDGWVIVYTGGDKFIGRMVTDLNGDFKKDLTDLELNPAFTWVNDQVMVGPGKMAMMRQAVPLQATLGSSIITIKNVNAIQELDLWPEDDKNEVLRQVENVIKSLTEESARKAGIELVKNMPRL